MHVAFRGTAAAANAAHDVAFLLLPLSDFPALRVGDDAWAARVHGGFAKMASNVADRLAERPRKWPRRRTVVLSGHSLGGALAILVGGALKGRGRSIQLCTFGAPPPGDAQYARLLDGVPCLRFANRCDPVPRSLGGADHGGLGGLVDLPMVREYVHVGTHVELEPWSETWRHAVEAVAGRQAGAALATAPAPAPTEPRPAAEPSTAQQLWSVFEQFGLERRDAHRAEAARGPLRRHLRGAPPHAGDQARASLEGCPPRPRSVRSFVNSVRLHDNTNQDREGRRRWATVLDAASREDASASSLELRHVALPDGVVAAAARREGSLPSALDVRDALAVDEPRSDEGPARARAWPAGRASGDATASRASVGGSARVLALGITR